MRAFWLGMFGLLATVAGAYDLFILCITCDMMHYRLTGPAYWRAVLADMALPPGLIFTAIGVAMIGWGLLAVAVFLPFAFGWTRRVPYEGFQRKVFVACALLILAGIAMFLAG